MANDLFGWDLLFRSVEKDFKKKEDVLVAFTHWFLIKSGFTCVGNGTARTLEGDEVRSEALPSEWNNLHDFNLRYVQGDNVYLLRGTVSNGDIIFNFVRAEDLAIASCMFQINDVVKEMTGDIHQTIPTYQEIMRALNKELVSPIFSKPRAVVATQTTEQPVQPRREQRFRRETPGNDFGIPARGPPRRPVIEEDLFWNPARDPRAIGRDDVDPFGQGGGMLFDPFRPRRDPRGPGPSFPDGLPRGAVPPGARYDPFNPPGTGRGGRSDPDPDHLPPPGYDDLFM